MAAAEVRFAFVSQFIITALLIYPISMEAGIVNYEYLLAVVCVHYKLHGSANTGNHNFVSFYWQPHPSTSQTTVSTPRQASDDTRAMSSATKRKFAYRRMFDATGSAPDIRLTTSQQPSTILVRSCMLNELVKNLCCTSCGCCALAVRVANCTLGLVCTLETHCTSCNTVINKTRTSDRVGVKSGGNVPYVVTRSAVSATMDMGVGYSGLVKLCRYLDTRCICHKTYSKHMKMIAQANMVATTRVLDDAAKVVRKLYRDRYPSLEEDSVIDLTVSFDGSWLTRGHSSMYGVGCVIEVTTGLVLDLVVQSLYCHSCACASARYNGEHTPEFKKWKDGHTECNVNYSGSSGGMEADAAEQLWSRSEDRHRFRYTTLLSDGDAKTHKHLCSLKVYGDTVIEKEECVNHVAKRLGSALRKLSTQSKKKGVTLGGRGYGKLTQATITKLTAYYGKAIRAHPDDLPAMTSAVFATYYHAVSTDDKPQHTHCPTGEDSWCFFKRAEATGEEPGPHRGNVGTPLSQEVATHVKDVYDRLGHSDLLSRCLRGDTQNPNEALHSKIWRKCPKTSFVGLQRVVAATCSGVAEFNSGIELSIQKLFSAMDIVPGRHLVASAVKADSERLQQSLRQAEASTKGARQARRVARAAAQDTSSQDYAPGAF